MNKKRNVGIIGAGRWGPNVIGALKRIEDVNLQIVADINQTALDLVKSRFSNLSATTDPMELITDDSLDALAICTPVETHLDFVEKALNNNKHVFVEKPLGKESSLCSKVCDLAESKGLKLVVGHVFLFNNSILSLKEIIQTGDIGDILHLTATRTNLGPVRKDVNASWDLTSHDLSIFNFLLDSNPLEVSCIGSCKLDSNIEDTTYTSFKYENEILAHAHASWLNPRKVRQITVVGSKKMLLWDDLNLDNPITIFDSSIGLEQSYYSDSFSSHRHSYNRGNVILPSVLTNEPLLDEMKHFVNVIQDLEKNRSSGLMGFQITKALEAADQSIKLSGAFVKVK